MSKLTKTVITLLLSSLILIPVGVSSSSRSTTWEQRQQQCMGTALFMEARGETLKGKRGVMDVVLHRAEEQSVSWCSVVKAKGQFPWAKKTHMMHESKWKGIYSETIAHKPVLAREYKFFYNPRIASPSWAKKMACRDIGRHRFCKLLKESENG